MRLSTLLGYGLPAMPLAALTLPLYIIVPTFYTESLGLPLASVGLVLLAVRIFDAVNDPLIGWVADGWRPAFGRRRTVLALAMPIAALAGYMLFAPPADAGITYLAIWALVLTVGYTGVLLPYAAWGAELLGDYQGRSRIVAVREGLTLVGTLIAISVPFIVGFADLEGWHGLAVLGALVAVGLVVFGAVAVGVVPEPTDHSTVALDPRQALAAMRRNGPFVRLIVAYLVNGLANAIPATLFLFFVSSVLGDEAKRGPLLFVYFAAAIAGLPLALAAARRLGKHRAWSIAMLAACAIFATVPLLGTGDFAAFGAICVATGVLLAFDLVLPSSIQADVIDVDTAETGSQRSGHYFAAWSLATKLSLAASVGLVFPLLAWFGFDSQAGAANDPSALMALALTYSWLPIALKLGAIALMWNFPLTAETQAGLRKRIEGF